MAALTIAAAAGTAFSVVPGPLLVLPFIASTAARRFGLTPVSATVDDDGLWLADTLVAPRADILDVWADPEDVDRRVHVAVDPDELLVVHLANAGQARRFAEALRPKAARHVFAGVRPRAIDALFPARLLAVVLSFVVQVGVRSPVNVLLFVFFAIGAYGFVVARQIDVAPEGLVLRSLVRSRTIPWPDLTAAMLDAIPMRVVRSPLMTTSPWTKHAHARAIAAAKTELEAREADRAAPPPADDTAKD